MKISPLDQLSSYVEALRPIIYIDHFDFEAVDRLIKATAGDKIKIYEYNEASGQVDFDNKNKIQDYNLMQFLAFFDTGDKYHCYLVLKDVHNQLDTPQVLAGLKSIARRTMYEQDFYITVFIVSTKLVIPVELEKFITVFDIPCPEQREIRQVIDAYAKSYNISIEDKVVDELTVSFKGLSKFEIRQILNLAYQQSGEINEEGKELILKEKEQVIKKTGLLEIIKVKENMDHIGGLDNLKTYIRAKAKIFNNLGEAKKFGVDLPKGILIVGMPGCGKSLTAKITAGLFEVPLLRLDVGKLMGKYVGESEDNLRRAIKTAEAVSPCVLWIDELEKAFAGVGGTGGGSDITTRLFGNFLTWLQEKESSVYVVATSNDISKLPPEFLRKGRFDELFNVDLPKDEERRQILEIHFKKRGRLTNGIDTIKLIKETSGYCGADIESIVRETIEEAFISGKKDITTDSVVKVIQQTKPISLTLKDQIENLKKLLEKFHMKPASI